MQRYCKYLTNLFFSVLFCCLECRGLESESCGLVDAEHEIHVLDGLTYGTFQQVVDGRSYEQFVAVFLHMYQCLVGVHYLLQINGLVAIMGEGGIGIEIFIGLDDILNRCHCFDDGCTEDTASEVTTIGDEVDVGIQIIC